MSPDVISKWQQVNLTPLYPLFKDKSLQSQPKYLEQSKDSP